METQIGEAAGKVWQALHSGGPQTGTAIAKATRLTSELLNQAIGWLAREGKLELVAAKKGKGKYALKEGCD